MKPYPCLITERQEIVFDNTSYGVYKIRLQVIWQVVNVYVNVLTSRESFCLPGYCRGFCSISNCDWERVPINQCVSFDHFQIFTWKTQKQRIIHGQCVIGERALDLGVRGQNSKFQLFHLKNMWPQGNSLFQWSSIMTLQQSHLFNYIYTYPGGSHSEILFRQVRYWSLYYMKAGGVSNN